jgi:Ca2+-binding EF-hand superfamily protein
MHTYAHRERDQRKALDGTYGVQKVLGGKHPETLDQLQQLALTMSSRGRLSEAERLFTLAWEGRKGTLGADHPLTQKSLRDLADVQRRSGWTDSSQELLYQNSCHGFNTRHPMLSREHAASMHCLGSSLKAASRLTALDQTLSSSMAAGRSHSVGNLTYHSVNKYKPPTTWRTHKAAALDIVNDSAHLKGRRLDDESAEELLREFSVVLFKRYGSFEEAFKDFDINGNGTLSGSEFAHHAKHIFDGNIGALFKALDEDRLGDISVKEFKKLGKLYKQSQHRRKSLEKLNTTVTTILPDSLDNALDAKPQSPQSLNG